MSRKMVSCFSGALAVVLVMLSTHAAAAQYACESYVGNVSTNRGEKLLIGSFAGSSWLMLCNLTTTVNGVTAEQCKTVFAQLLAAQLANKKVRLSFDDALTCSTQPSWTYATGWFWGPDILEG